MNQVWKYTINDTNSYVTLHMPVRAQIISAQVQNGIPTVWALVDPAAPQENRQFVWVTTGEQFDASPLQFIATFLLDDGRYVLHLFERVLFGVKS